AFSRLALLESPTRIERAQLAERIGQPECRAPQRATETDAAHVAVGRNDAEEVPVLALYKRLQVDSRLYRSSRLKRPRRMADCIDADGARSIPGNLNKN